MGAEEVPEDVVDRKAGLLIEIRIVVRLAREVDRPLRPPVVAAHELVELHLGVGLAPRRRLHGDRAWFALSVTISTVAPTTMIPRSTRPVTTVPRPSAVRSQIASSRCRGCHRPGARAHGA